MTLRSVTKAKRAARTVTCTACDGEMVSVPVVVLNRYGEPSEGIEVRHVPCGVCDSTGRTKPAMRGCPCCLGPKADRCPNCAKAARKGAEVHWCPKAADMELDYATELELMPSPGKARGTAGRDSTAADMGVGERSGQR